MGVSEHILTRKTTGTRLFLAGLFVALWVLSASSTPAYAFLGKDKIPSLAYETKETPEEYQAKSDEYVETPLSNKSLAFKVRLPKRWVSLDSDLAKGEMGTDIFRQLAVFNSPPNIIARSIFRVRSIDINSLISADNWIISYMLEMGFSMEGMNVVSRNRVEAQYTIFVDGEPMVARAVIERSGAKMIIAEYLVHQDNYNDEKDDQLLAMKGFALLSPDKGPPVEMKTYSFVDIAKFEYPAGWQLVAPGITTIDRMEAAIVNIKEINESKRGNGSQADQRLNGRVDVTLVSKAAGTTLKDEINILNVSLSNKGLKLGDLISTVKDVNPNSLVQSCRVDSYKIESEDKHLVGYEYWVAVMQTEGRYYLVRLLTIGRGEDFVTWSKNTETFRALIESIAPANDNDD